MAPRPRIARVEVSAYRVPTEEPESDGTLRWDATGVVVVEVAAGAERGVGWTYNDPATAQLVSKVSDAIVGASAMDVKASWDRMRRAFRNVGTRGPAASAIAAIDVALWDLKARLLGLPLVSLLGQVREHVPLYGSGGFTSYDLDHLTRQLGDWVDEGFAMVKMKVGPDPRRDRIRVQAAREAIGEAELFVDANGAYDRKQALAAATAFADQGVTWFEEPVTSDDREGLRLLRDRRPTGMAIAAGEYLWEIADLPDLLPRVDVVQLDVTRLMGITGFMAAAAVCEALSMPLSAHCAPALHLHPCCAASRAVHLEYFHDHSRLEAILFEGAVEPRRDEATGAKVLSPDLARAGHGLSLSRERARQFAL